MQHSGNIEDLRKGVVKRTEVVSKKVIKPKLTYTFFLFCRFSIAKNVSFALPRAYSCCH